MAAELGDGQLIVLSVATGSKCAGLDRVNFDGTSLHDCHAEVLARRALQWYVFDVVSS